MIGDHLAVGAEICAAEAHESRFQPLNDISPIAVS